MKRLAAIASLMVLAACAHQAPQPISSWAKCEIDCAADGSTVRGLAEDETKIYCICARPAAGT